MKRKAFLISVLLVLILLIAVFTKPNDKEIKIRVIEVIWGKLVPDKYKVPGYYEQFMNLTTKDIDIDNWLFVKRIKYTVKDTTYTIGYAAFGKVMMNK